MRNKMALPNLFILGPAKTATTSLAHWLSQHNEFYVSEPKETLYFEFEYDRGPAYYSHKYFRHHNGESVVVDARPMNLTVGYVAERILETCPNAKFIVVLRNPLERSYSDWGNWSRMRPGRAHKTFQQAISYNIANFDPFKFDLEGDYVPYCDSKGGSYNPSYIEASLYGHNIGRYVDLFGKDRMMLLDFNDVITMPQDTIDRISKFAGVESQIISDIGERNMIGGKGCGKTLAEIENLLNPKTLQDIYEIFKSDFFMLKSYGLGIDGIIDKWRL